MGFPATRLGDMHLCPIVAAAGGSPILPPCAITVLIGGQPAARMGDLVACILPVPPPDLIALGSLTVFILGQPAARMLDPCACGGAIAPPCMPMVLIG